MYPYRRSLTEKMSFTGSPLRNIVLWVEYGTFNNHKYKSENKILAEKKFLIEKFFWWKIFNEFSWSFLDLFLLNLHFLYILKGPVQSGQSWVKVDGPGGLNWTIQTTNSGRSWAKVDGPKELKLDGLRKWTVPKYESGRSFKRVMN